MLIIVPPSESKRPPARHGRPVDVDGLSFPDLRPTRRRLVEALIETSADVDAFERLGVRASRVAEVAANTHLLELPAIPPLELYTGPLHRGLDAAGLSAEAAARADQALVIASALWGAVRPRDRIPPYRLHLFARLLGVDRIDHAWRGVLPEVLARAAGSAGVVVDLRSPEYQQAGTPAGLGDRTVTLRVDQGPAGHRIGDVVAKRVRGEAAHLLLEAGTDPSDVHELGAILAEAWPVRVDAPERTGRPWTMTLSID